MLAINVCHILKPLALKQSALIPSGRQVEWRNMWLFCRKQEKQPEIPMLSGSQLKHNLDLGENVGVVDVRQP
jgi:hypothetical protein